MVSEILICGYHSLGNNNELFLEVPVHSDVVPRTNKIKANDLTDNEKKAKKQILNYGKKLNAHPAVFSRYFFSVTEDFSL